MNTLLPVTAALSLAAMSGGDLGPTSYGDSPDSESRWALSRALYSSRVAAETAALGGATAWINSPPLSAAELHGKIVVVQFWTYSCINWLRTLPFLRALDEHYGRTGLIVIGVHSPEFGFEHSLENVRQAVRDRNITYPVAVDSNLAIWRAFGNNYWPALYIFDAQGRLRHQQFGEQGSEESESTIRRLLAETGAAPGSFEAASVRGTGAEAPADWTNLQSPENYLGYERTRHFVSPGGVARDSSRIYRAPPRLQSNQWSLSGSWRIGKEAALLERAPGGIESAFHARDLNLVMGPGPGNHPVRFRVLIDGQAPGESHGADVDRDGFGTVSVPRLYQLIRHGEPIIDRRFEIIFADPGVQAYSFSFG